MTPTSSEDKKESLKKAPRPKPLNYWKISFLVLVGILIGSTIFLTTRIFEKRETQQSNQTALVKRDGTPVLTINSNKTQINKLIDFYLTDFQKGSDVKYQFELRNEALLTGEFKVLGFPVELYLYFDPYVTEDGNIQLKAKSLSVGTLDLPISEVLKMVKRSFKLPEWIEIDPKEQVAMIRLDQFQMQNGLFIKANKLNLIDDEIQVSLYLPEKESK